jgi:hypothetical protein
MAHKRRWGSWIAGGKRLTEEATSRSSCCARKRHRPEYVSISVLSHFIELPLLWLGVLVAERLLTTKKVTAVTTERLSGEARLVYIWLMAPGWFERLGAIVCVMCMRELCREKVVLKCRRLRRRCGARGIVGSPSSPSEHVVHGPRYLSKSDLGVEDIHESQSHQSG